MAPLFAALLLATQLLGAEALNLIQPQDGQAPKVVSHPFQRRHIPDRFKQMDADRQRIRRRQDSNLYVDVTLLNEEALYLMNASIGTPPQDFVLHIDTGSSDLWVNAADSAFCQQYEQACDIAGAYSPNKSSTYQYVNSAFQITYVDGSGASGDYVTDDFRFADVEVDNLQFGVGYQATKSVGVLGIGYPTHEVSAQYGVIYDNLPVKLVEAGRINTNAYSLWLNDLDASTGEILFGGVNADKYEGELQTLPVIAERGGVYAELIIALTAIGANGNEGSIANDLKYAALLDSGTSLMYLPDDVADRIFDALNAQWDASQGAAFVSCAFAQSTETLDLTFSGVTIKVPMNELVLAAGTNVCILGIAKGSGSDVLILGDTFLRSAYTVYDLQNNEISLAQTKFNAEEGGTVQEITRSGVPSATEVQDPVTDVVLPSGAAATPVEGSAGPTARVGFGLVGVVVAAAGVGAMALV